MPDKYQNKYRIPSARLQGYDYGQNGAYFITICTKDRIHYFGEIAPMAGISVVETQNLASLQEYPQNLASPQPTPIGVIANEYWQKIPEHFPFIIIDEFVVMPNHVHGILIISKDTEKSKTLVIDNYTNKFGPQSGNISSVIRGYKAGVKSHATKNNIEFSWQTRFYDRIIRDKEELGRIRKYIVENPGNWSRDRNNKNGIEI